MEPLLLYMPLLIMQMFWTLVSECSETFLFSLVQWLFFLLLTLMIIFSLLKYVRSILIKNGNELFSYQRNCGAKVVDGIVKAKTCGITQVVNGQVATVRRIQSCNPEQSI